MSYVDGFVIPVPKKNLKAYLKMARQGGDIWMEYGALEYVECVGDDLNVKEVLPFPRMAKSKPGETVVFSWIIYKSKQQRDRIMKKIMKDPRMNAMMDPKSPPFDCKRMACGGFKVVVERRRSKRG